MDPSTDFVYMKKILMNTKAHYKNPHTEAMRMKFLWSYDDDKKINFNNEKELANKYYIEIINLIENSIDNLSIKNAVQLLKKALYIDPISHKLYALRGKIYEIKRDYERAIFCYEKARRILLKYDKNSKDDKKKIIKNYKNNLINLYKMRGKFHEDNEKFIEAVADYEQILILGENLSKNSLQLHQNNLLNCLRKLDKYDAYQLAWSEFIKSSSNKSERLSYLMTHHAEYKINIKEISSARRMLKEAISLNENNRNAKDLLQLIFDTGDAMLSHGIIWSINGYYEKALSVIDKGSDCDPYNQGLAILKTIVLRISGRFKEAFNWLKFVDKSFEKFIKSSKDQDKRESVIRNLSVQDMREILINQWHLIRYDMALEYMINDRYEEALKILCKDQYFINNYSEPCLLIGDCLIKNNYKINEALRSYKKANELNNNYYTNKDYYCKKFKSMKIIISQRIAEILNSESFIGLQQKERKKKT